MKENKIDIYNISCNKLKNTDKKVTVVIPNYNYENYIIERIDSVINQSYPIYELLILDDKSTDDSVKVIEKKIKTIDKKIKVKFIKNEKNSGNVFKQWSKGFEEATGDYIWIAEADDSAHPLFLETTLNGFDENVIMSYTESMRIDENNNIIRTDSQDLYNIYNTNRWNSNYLNSGIEEIKNYLSVTNTILNVSSIVFKKNENYPKFLKEATNFKVAGDWYFYYKILELGDIAFSNKPYNYFRKHSKSVSTVVKDDIEYEEICRIQNEIVKKYNLDLKLIKHQQVRRSYMDSNVSKNVRKKRIAFVMPHPGFGSGGHRTIIQNINALYKEGYEVDIYVEEDFVSTGKMISDKINQYYEYCPADCYVGVVLRKEYDLIFATGWTTIDDVKNIKCDKKAYFIQDYEPWFLPMGENYMKVENSYKLGFEPITIGKWLSHKMISEFDSKSQYFDFCANLDVYKKLDNIEKENAICFIYQPEKPRRCDKMGLKALKLVKELKPDIKIYLYGSSLKTLTDLECENLNIIPIEKCNELYNKCKLGLCISASNPSRIPFEMMASGLPVVEIYKENNLYDFPTGAIKLANPTAEGIAATIIDLIDNNKELDKMSKIGSKYMKNYPLEYGFEQFVKAVNNLLYEKEIDNLSIDKTYNEKPIIPSKNLINKSNEIFTSTNLIDHCSNKKRTLRRWKKTCKEFIKKIFNKCIYILEKI